jgi:hypothetical protein
MAEVPPQRRIPYAQRRAEEISGLSVEAQPVPKPIGIETGGPFDPRLEVSEDARYISGRIVKHLWIIFVLLPVVLAILFAILKP